MPNYRRFRQSGATWFFTVVAHHRRRLFCTPEFRHALKSSIQRYRKQLPFTICGWVLLPDHMHCMWTLPGGDADYSKRWKLIKQSVTHQLHRKIHVATYPDTPNQDLCEGRVWQRRFWEHHVRDSHDFQSHLDYLHYNPVKHGLVLSPQAWPFSTLHRYQRLGIYPNQWAADPERGFDRAMSFGEAEPRRWT